MAEFYLDVDTNTTPSGKVRRYGWERLRAVGDCIIFRGTRLQPLTIQQAARDYANRRGWRVKTIHQFEIRRVKVVRIA